MILDACAGRGNGERDAEGLARTRSREGGGDAGQEGGRGVQWEGEKKGKEEGGGFYRLI